jgi:hypothetical protein
MIKIKCRKNTETFDFVLSSLDAQRRGQYEWTAQLPPIASNDPLAGDLLRVGQAIYLADRAVRRPMGIGNALRSFEVTIPVREPKRLAPVAPLFERVAEFATCDEWRLRFTKLSGDLEKKEPKWKAKPESVDVVALFSGGLDSLCGAAYVASQRLRATFVNHSPPGRDAIRSLLGGVFSTLGGGEEISRDRIATYRLETREASGEGRRAVFPEHSRRSRPFFFLSLAASTAVRLAADRVWMSENGALALSLPIRADTHGPFMARQAHSFLLHGFSEIMKNLPPRDGPVPVFDNPFVRKTKGEACLELKDAGPQSLHAMSCEYTGRQRALLLWWLKKHRRWRRQLGGGPQCGLCIPCLVRRAALKRAKIDDPASRYFADAPSVRQVVEERGHAVDVFGTENPPPLLNMIATNVVHLPRFCEGLLSMSSGEFAIRYLPELRANRDVPSAPAPTVAESFALMQRFAKEILDFVQ